MFGSVAKSLLPYDRFCQTAERELLDDHAVDQTVTQLKVALAVVALLQVLAELLQTLCSGSSYVGLHFISWLMIFWNH